MRTLIVASSLMLALAGRAAAAQAPTDSAAVAAAVEGFHRAIARGDSAAVLAALADDAVLLESGDTEARDEYRAHHLAADIAFTRAVASERSPVRVTVRGDVAWASATSTTRGRFHGRDVDSAGAELMVLTRAPGGA